MGDAIAKMLESPLSGIAIGLIVTALLTAMTVADLRVIKASRVIFVLGWMMGIWAIARSPFNDARLTVGISIMAVGLAVIMSPLLWKKNPPANKMALDKEAIALSLEPIVSLGSSKGRTIGGIKPTKAHFVAQVELRNVLDTDLLDVSLSMVLNAKAEGVEQIAGPSVLVGPPPNPLRMAIMNTEGKPVAIPQVGSEAVISNIFHFRAKEFSSQFPVKIVFLVPKRLDPPDDPKEQKLHTIRILGTYKVKRDNQEQTHQVDMTWEKADTDIFSRRIR